MKLIILLLTFILILTEIHPDSGMDKEFEERCSDMGGTINPNTGYCKVTFYTDTNWTEER